MSLPFYLSFLLPPLSFLFFLHPPLILLPLLVPPSPSPRYAKLHLHPLRSRVRDMEHKLKVAMDNLVRGVKVAASSRPPPGEEGREGIKEEPKLLVTKLQNVYKNMHTTFCHLFTPPSFFSIFFFSNSIQSVAFLLYSPIQTLRCNSTAAALWPCPHHGHSGLPDGSSVCLPPAHPESCWPGGHAVPLGQDLHRLDLLRHSWKTPDR